MQQHALNPKNTENKQEMTSMNWNGGVVLICEDSSNNCTTLLPSASHFLHSSDSEH